MNIQIKKIILWPKNTSNKIREISFSLDKINIITGDSHKGKSALIQIIDYCLGSGKCTIPVGIIREKTSWFGVLLKNNDLEILLARKEPGDNQITDDMFIAESKEINLSTIEILKNTNRKNVVNRLNQLAGLSTQDFNVDETNNQFLSAASFRDTAAFQFQPQHIIANPYTLFYKADTYEHREKLRTIFPLILGAITNEALSLEKELKELNLRLSKKRLELQTKKTAVESWSKDLKILLLNSMDLGLFKQIQFDEFSLEQYLYNLRKIVSDFKEHPIPLYESGATNSVTEKLNELYLEERDIENQLNLRKIRLSKLLSLNDTTKKYLDSLNTQERRLEPLNWFKRKEPNYICPFCEAENESAHNQIRALENVSQKIENIQSSIGENKINLDKEVLKLRNEIDTIEIKLNLIRTTLQNVYKNNDEEDKKRSSIEEIYKFIGKIEQALTNVEATQIDSELENEINSLQTKYNLVNAKLTEIKNKGSLDNILQKISSLISYYIKLLDVERKENTVNLDIKELTLKITSDDFKREDFLWELGSGANFMSYHLSTLFALHEYFLTSHINYIPSFLILDQPSQVYYGKDETSDDFIQTKKIFSASSECFKKLNGALQIILLEHAPKELWNDITNINLVAEWKNDEALIPKEWQ